MSRNLAKTTIVVVATAVLTGFNGFSLGAERKISAVDLTDRNLSVEDIDPAIYFDVDDTNDPFHEIYTTFRARRASDMADPSKPPPIEPYKSVHRSGKMPWGALPKVLPFDWASLRKAAPQAAEQLERVVKARLVFDHPDIKITQLMLGPGATLPGHAEGSPGFYYIIEGSGEITVEGATQSVTPGTTVKLEPYDVRRVYASTAKPLKLIWVRWAPGGDQQYLAAGYYLTGANQHVQPKEANLPRDFLFWGKRYSTQPVSEPASAELASAEGSVFATQMTQLNQARAELGESRKLYKDTPAFSYETDSTWINEEQLKNSGFFWAKDIGQLGELLYRWEEVMRLKGFFRVVRADGGWDFNISQMVWGPHSRYVEHSHSIPEFYYMLSGPVEHWIDDIKYRAMPGDIFLTNSYQPHQSRGIVDDLPFRNIGASWAPNGDRSVFQRPFFLVEPLPEQPESSFLSEAAAFH